MNFKPIDLLPQKAPMAFITDIESVDFDNQKMITRIDIRDTDLLYQKNINGISSVAALEYMAQSIACYIGAQDIHITGETKALRLPSATSVLLVSYILHSNEAILLSQNKD